MQANGNIDVAKRDLSAGPLSLDPPNATSKPIESQGRVAATVASRNATDCETGIPPGDSAGPDGTIRWGAHFGGFRLKSSVIAVVLIALAACGSDDRPNTDSAAAPAVPNTAGPAGRILNVVTTTTQITDFVRNIGKDHVRVYAVLKANVDPHDYETTPSDIDAIANADVLIKNGLGLEGWFDDTIRSANPKGVIVDASVGIEIRRGDGSTDEKTADPHIWHNPQNAKAMVSTIARALEAADPAAAAVFERNLYDYAAKLDALDANVRAQLDTLTNKKLVTNHDAFGYYVDHYGLNFVGAVIPSFDTQAELSPADVNDLVARIKAEGVKAIFSESSLPPKTAGALAEEAGVKVVAGEDALYGDTLGPDGTDGDTYLRMVAHNTKEIVDNLA